MSYYDHATAMAFKVGRWREERELRNFELEAQAAEQRASVISLKKQSIIRRCLSVFCSQNSTEQDDKLKTRNH